MSKKSAESLPLCQHVDGLVDELRLRVPAALESFDAEAVHKSRVTTRRLKAAMQLLGGILDEQHARPFVRLGRNLRRRLGPMRDADVMLGHLDEIKPGTRHAPAADWLRQEIVHDREVARAKSTQKTSSSEVLSRLGVWWGLRQELIQANPDIDALLADSVQTQLEQFAAQAEQIATSHDPHQLRIAGKLLRYTLEMAQTSGHKLPNSVLRSFKRMQDFLGLWHDYVVLAERAMTASLEKHLALHNASMQKQVLAMATHLIARSERELVLFAKLWAEQGADLAKTIREVFGLPSPIKPPQTDPGPADSPAESALDSVSTAPPPAA